MVELKHVSASSLNTYLGDYSEWYKRYILGERIPENIYMRAGTAVHNFFENFYMEEPKEGETIAQFATRRFKECYNEQIKGDSILIDFVSEPDAVYDLDLLKSWCEARVRTWVQETQRLEPKYGAQKAFQYNSPVKVEEELQDFIGEVPVKGFIDAVYAKNRWQKDNGLQFLLVDYKTSSKQDNTIHDKYFIQLLMYAYIYKRRGKRVNWVIVDYLKYNQKYYFRVNDKLMEGIERLCKDVWQGMKERIKLHNEGVDVSEMKPEIKIGDYL